MSKSKMSIRQDMILLEAKKGNYVKTPGLISAAKLGGRIRKSTVSPNPKINKQAFNRQRTFGSTSLSPTDRGNSTYNLKRK